ncbi:MAG: M56 family metallopeptidase [Candidatus Eisenbacteria bacterium]
MAAARSHGCSRESGRSDLRSAVAPVRSRADHCARSDRVATAALVRSHRPLAARFSRLDRPGAFPEPAFGGPEPADPSGRRASAGLQTRLRAAATLAGVALPHIAWTPAAVLPSVRGLVHPRIVVPWFALETLETQELAAVLAHEDAHRRARDPWHLAIQRVAFVLFYFFPPLWLVLSRLHETSELACDEDVLARGLDPRALARAIARSVTVPLAPRTHDLLSAPVGLWSTRLFHRSLLKERLHRLETMRRYPIMHRHHVVLALAGTVFGLALILPLGLRAEEKPDGATIQLADRAADLDGSADERSDSERSSDERAGTGHSADLAANDTSKSDPSKNERVDELEEGMTPPKPTHMVPAEYPKAEHAEGVSGRINLQLVVDEQGHPTEIEVVLGVPGHPAFGDNAVAAMRQWKFEPATKDDEPVAMKIIVPFLFQLD